jgi:hypothetical protein
MSIPPTPPSVVKPPEPRYIPSTHSRPSSFFMLCLGSTTCVPAVNMSLLFHSKSKELQDRSVKKKLFQEDLPLPDSTQVLYNLPTTSSLEDA